METERLNQIFSKNLLYWLNQRRKTQADLYKHMNVSSATVSDWCNCKKIPRTDKLVQISQWLMIELSDLLYENERVPNEDEKIRFRLNDDTDFKETVKTLFYFEPDKYNKVKDYIKLLNK